MFKAIFPDYLFETVQPNKVRILPLRLLLRNTHRGVQFEDGGNGEADNPFVAVGKEHEGTGKHQNEGAEDLLATQAFHVGVAAAGRRIDLSQGKESGTDGIDVGREFPSGDLDGGTYPGHHTANDVKRRNQMFHSISSSKTKISSLGFFIRYFSRAMRSMADESA